ncbi:MAG TPA: C25 family cysteine peptidase, partial [Chitinophagaceae bacterium]
MKRILLPLLLFTGFFIQAQVYNNEWIDYSKTYYKFRIGSNGLFRISQATLNSIGLGSTPAENFQLWRNGQEIPIYTTAASGPMGGSDYIEFWGQMNDGKPDKPLYVNPDYQLNDHWSFQTDTAAYFLTVNTGANRRLVPSTNDVAGNTLSPEPYFMYTLGNYLHEKINIGNAAIVQTSYVYSSEYDKGEGWTCNDIGNGVSYTVAHSNLHVYTSGPTPTFTLNAAGNAVDQRSFHATINGTQVAQQSMDYYEYAKIQTNFPLSTIATNSATVSIVNDCPTSGDRMVVAQYEITYPRQFNFDNLKNFVFGLPANINGNYVEISNFNYGTTAPVLYDITNGKRYVADISVPSLVRIALAPSSVDRTLILVSEDNSNVNSITTIQPRNFINYGLSANQGDYLIISNQVLYTASDGSSPVDDYRAYRNSPAGGGYNAKVYDIDQLVDQFGYGIKKNPLAIRNFIQYSLNNYAISPKFAFLIGKGIDYADYRSYESVADVTTKTNLEKLNLVPTFGYPASDNLFSCLNGNNIPLVPTGRLSVINADEVAVYLKKVKTYEATQAFSSPLIADKAWMKNVVHVAGADDDNLQAILDQLMSNYKGIISDTLFGGNVSSFSKSSPDQVQQLASDELKALFQEGLSVILYFGHSSASTLDFNLDDPSNYNNTGKYPIFIALGCNAGNLYNFDQTRLLIHSTISENFVLTPNKGSVAFLATTSLGIVQYLDIFNSNNYKAISFSKYGRSIGEIMQEAVRQTFNVTSQNDFYARVHCEQISLNGDPALKYNTHSKPDYVIEDPLVKISPSIVSVAQSSFHLDAKMMNLGMAVDSNIVVEIKRTYPNNVTQVIKRDTIAGIRYIDSISMDIPIVATRDRGQNKITITVDADNKVDELYETNNSITKEIFIYDNVANPVFPYNYSIVNHQNLKLVASTANPFAISAQYSIELDTTELFNSPSKLSNTFTTIGGVFEYSPPITLQDSTVYYWRVGQIPQSGEPLWNTASFVYLANGGDGFNQSHYFQHLKSQFERISLDSASRRWNFDLNSNNVFARNGVYPATSSQGAYYSGTINNKSGFIGPGCAYDEVIINVIDPTSLNVWKNNYSGSSGLYQSYLATCGAGRDYNFEYLLNTSAWRKKAMDFLDSIPNGTFVLIRSNTNPTSSGNTYPGVWKTDQTLFGAGNSLYQRLYDQGFTGLDSITTPRSWVFLYKKNRPNDLKPQWVISQGIYDGINVNSTVYSPDTLGYITSPAFGPAKKWNQLHWRGKSVDAGAGDAPTVDVYGIDQGGNQLLLYPGINQSTQDFDLSSVDATAYPYLMLKMKNLDSINYTPYQLNYWRIDCVPVPEGAIAPNISFQMDTTAEVGQPVNFKIAFKNVSEKPFDSLKVSLVVTDKNNVPNIIPIPRQKPLVAGDTLTLSTTINTKSLSGTNSLYVDFNPNNDQPEQYLFNNFAYKNFYVKPDSLNPLLDVTFDGQHILNKDIVSSKPHILVKLKDEAKWMVLTDTSLFTFKVQYPDNSLHSF